MYYTHDYFKFKNHSIRFAIVAGGLIHPFTGEILDCTPEMYASIAQTALDVYFADNNNIFELYAYVYFPEMHRTINCRILEDV